jgi:hypothetical protein
VIQNKQKLSLEMVANILVVVVGISLIAFFAYKYYPKAKTYEAEFLNKGKGFTGLEEIDFKSSPRTLVLGISTKCPYCTQSIPFYKKLIETVKYTNDVRIVAAFPQKQDEIDRYLTEHDFNIKTVPNVVLIDSSIEMTPTMVWIDSDKKIVKSWQGYLDKDGQDDFWDFYNSKLNPK